tara:strand:- start:2363 stop:4096 length:1734 start_codon:yes stop_codon:yes gene_type:complete
MFLNLKRLFYLLDFRRKINLTFVFFILILIGILENIGIGLIFPLLTLALGESASSLFVINFFNTYFGISDSDYIFKIIIILFAIIVILKNILTVVFSWMKEKLLLDIAINLKTRLLGIYVEKPLTFHFKTNSSQLIRNLTNEINNTTKGFLLSWLIIIGEFLFLLTLMGVLLVSNIAITLGSFLFLGLISAVMLFFHKKKLYKFSQTRMKYAALTFKVLKESFDSIKEVKVASVADLVLRDYAKFSYRGGKMNVLAGIYSSLPRAFFEIVLVATISYWLLFYLKSTKSIVDFIPLLGLYSVAIFRALPSVNRVVNNIQGLRYSVLSFETIYNDMKESQQITKKALKKISLTNEIRFNNISFAYENRAQVLEDVSFILSKNTFTGIIGNSGAGKTTLLDLLLGLISAKEGNVKIDGCEINLFENFKNWAKKVSYVPQAIYIYDDTIKNNITLNPNLDIVDNDRLEKAIKISKLNQVIEGFPDKLNTILGEGGKRISGGQKQRIGIARAIYRDSDVIIFDESTNALDSETEIQILNNLQQIKKNKIVIFSSHSQKLIEKYSDQIIILNNGKATTKKIIK